MASKVSQIKGHDMLSTAEDLLETFEDASELLDEIEEKYIINNNEGQEKDYTIHQFREGLDKARNLFSTLKREKWRLNKRELSVELRMGELEDYKSHLKKDMSSLNETVDILSVRIIQLENTLAESQDTIEKQEADVHHYKDLLESTQHEVKNLHKTNDGLRDDLKAVKTVQDLDLLEKKFKSLEMANSILLEENKNLKTIIRSQESSISKMKTESPSKPKPVSNPLPPPRPKKEDALIKPKNTELSQIKETTNDTGLKKSF